MGSLMFSFYGLRPFVEIGFMPEDLAADKGQLSYREGGWACPPKIIKNGIT